MADTPLRAGFAELSATWAPAAGLTGRGEVGYRPLSNLSLFGYGEWNQFAGPSAGGGVRLVW